VVVALSVALFVALIVAQSATTRVGVRGVIPPQQVEPNTEENEMHTNLYLIEKLDRQVFAAEAAGTRTAAELTNMKMTRSQTMKRIKLIAAAVLVAATLVGVAPSALTASHSSMPTVASLCCYIKR
jgi:hypothetical protein